MSSIIERVKFRNILALIFGGSTIAALVFVPSLDDIVKGALIAIVTLITQFYFRKSPASESQQTTGTTAQSTPTQANGQPTTTG